MNIFYAMPKEALLERLGQSFEMFKQDHGRYPNSYEIVTGNKYVFPSAKTLDRRFGGVKKVRELLGLEITNYTAGEHRSKMLKETLLPRAQESEGEFYKKLLKIVPKTSIHQQESYSFNIKVLSDFILDLPKSRIGVDVFYANSYRSMSGCVSAKERKLKRVSDTNVFLLSVSDRVSDDDIKKYIQRRKAPLAENITIMTGEAFLKYLQDNLNEI
jgi:hypothetical protein